MPTGGGKSITFQVPAMAKPGLCLVVTPLIALMRDQVSQLTERKIKAVAIHSGLSRFEIDVALDNCIYGDFKFLYLSPERLSSPLFKARLEQMRVNLIAVDEAHCISQWGYDFRPSYLEICKIRETLPNVPILALTATATKAVAADIQKRLDFKKPNIIRQSFERKNLVYWVRQTEDKPLYLLKILHQQAGSAIVYVRSRRKTVEIAKLLFDKGIAADYYHAGLESEDRARKQLNWKSNRTRVMVSTNAFGMGIDKADVRLVVHWDLPDSPEAYFQEAGRAGRDGRQAFAILLFHPGDKASLNQSFTVRFPELNTIRAVYKALGHYFQLVPGTGKGQIFEFDLNDFSQKFGFHTLVAYHSLKHIERAGYLVLTDDIDLPSRIHFRVGRDDLYKFQVVNKQFDGIIKLILRLYTGLFMNFVPINEAKLAKHANTKTEIIERVFTHLHNQGIIYYLKPTKKPRLLFSAEKLDEKSLLLPVDTYGWREKESRTRLDTMFFYAESNDRCRSQILLMYFGEKDPFRCGQCDFCKSNDHSDHEDPNDMKDTIVELVGDGKKDIKSIYAAIDAPATVVDDCISQLVEEGRLTMKDGFFFL